MSRPVLQRKRSSLNFEERSGVIKRQFSERTLVARKMEESLHLGRSSPRVPSSPVKFELGQETDNSFFPDSSVFKKDSKAGQNKPDIKREESADLDEYCLSDDVENEHVAIRVGEVPIIPVTTTTTDEECQGDDEPDGFHKFFSRIGDKVEDLLPHHPHHDHHHQEEEVDCDHEGFTVHLPAHFHRFDTPLPFGARLYRSKRGYKIAQVLRETTAHKANLRESDVVTHVNETDLKMLEIRDIQSLFMNIGAVFTLTILRERGEGDHVQVEKIIIKVTVTDEFVVEVVHTEVVWSRKPHYVGTSAASYITQDADAAPQIYLNATGSRLTMGTYIDERAKFHLDFYAVLGEMPNGQRCVIRNYATNQIYDAIQGNMKTVKNYRIPDTSCLLDKIMRPDGTFVFESVENKGHYLIALTTGALKLSQYSGLLAVPSEGSFRVNAVKESVLSSVRV